VALSEIFQEAAEAVAPLIHNKGLRMTIDASDQLPAVYCDRLRIRQVILNLVSNAARFTEHGSIDIKATSSKNQVLVSVTDTGPGISTEDIERIFEPFCQGTLQDQGRDKGGSGLGLTISKQFVELHGGQMWLTSQLGEGTTFFFTLPIRPLPDAPRRAGGWIQPDWIWRESTFVSAGLESPDRTPKPCIAVFDETGGLNRELEKFQDVLVVQALDLAKSDLLSPDTIDVVWVNVPPGQHSQDVQQAVESRFPGVPIVTSNFLDGGWPEVNDHVQFLTKPVSMEKLSAAIDRAGGEVARVLVVDDDADVRSLLKRLLHIYDSYLEVAVAENGQDAVHMAVAHPYDLILLDIVMLSMSGWEVLRVLRENEATRDVPVIILSAQDLADRSPVSHTYAVNSEEGFTCKRLLECTAVLANLLMERGPTRVPAPEENRGA
jgi:CheY-like chemotaxis protein